ncbi:MAG: RIP metalloprotease RseP [Erythrobacter sp. RIFCSPHIGHO2_12_FULL_63_10]|nr:MAG: RIP metalloprotease RseP [Erythrobacter sp. RIFCSPHIGHO2_12_FULL_63_10]
MIESPPFWMYIVGILLLLGPLITVHELGHYVVGRWFGVKSDIFSIGFGRELFGWTDRRGTRWRVAAIPLGGYVQFKGDMNPASIPDAEALASASPEERAGSFHCQPLWQRALIVFAGPATNLLVTLAIFASFFAVFGRPVPIDPENSTVVAEFVEGSAAKDAGVRIGDKIRAIDGEPIVHFSDIAEMVMLYPGRQVTLEVERAGQQLAIPVTIGASVESDQFGNEARIGRLGFRSGGFEMVPTSVPQALVESVDASWGLVRMMATGVAQIVVGDRSIVELGGPLRIAKYSGEQLSLGLASFVNFAALISLNLAFINLLPIPALDGGHLAFYAAEAVRRKPVSPRGMEWAYRTGVALVLMLMVVVTVNDLVALPIFGS